MKKENPIIKCECGCNTELNKYDKYGRSRKFISGHNGRKYKDPKQFKREWNHRNRKARYTYKATLLRKHKSEIVEAYGGKCNRCDYKYDGTNAAAFDFHHINESQKSFNVGINSFNKFSKEAVYKEAEKCELLCAICHRLHHSSEY